MTRLKRVALLVVATHLSFTTARGQAPQPSSTKLQITAASADARTAFWGAWDDQVNVFASRARSRSLKAVSLDPSFGLARVFSASIASATTPGMTPAQREQELNRGVVDAARASTGELILATAMRAQALGHAAEARTLAAAAVALMPDDPYVASFQAGVTPGDRVPLQLELTRKFPSFAPSFNTLAYAQLAAGDSAVALKTIAEYVRLAPNHPNAHDSYAELLQITGRYADALPHYDRAAQLDTTFAQAYAGMAESHMLMKKYAEAIPFMQHALRVDPTYAPGYALIAQAYLQTGQPDEARATFLAGAEKVSTPVAKVGQLTSAALMLVPAGKPKEAVAALTTVAAGAEEQSLPVQASTTYRTAALIEAAFGDRRAVAGHLAKAAAILPPPPPNATPASLAAPFRTAALAYAMSGQLDLAKASAAQFAQAVTAGTPAQQNNNHELSAIVAIGDKNLARAKEELALAGPGAVLGKAMLATALKASGKKGEASTMKAAILTADPALTVFDVIARAKAKKL